MIKFYFIKHIRYFNKVKSNNFRVHSYCLVNSKLTDEINRGVFITKRLLRVICENFAHFSDVCFYVHTRRPIEMAHHFNQLTDFLTCFLCYFEIVSQIANNRNWTRERGLE